MLLAPHYGLVKGRQYACPHFNDKEAGAEVAQAPRQVHALSKWLSRTGVFALHILCSFL